MQQWRIICIIVSIILLFSRELQSFVMANTVIKHRAIINRNEPDLSSELKANLISQDNHAFLKISCQPEQGLRAELFYRKLPTDGADRLEMQYWTEEGSKSQDEAWVTDRYRVILPNSRQIIEDALRSSVMHVQIGSSTPLVFKPSGVSSALSKMQASCPSDAPPPDHNGLAK